MRFCGNCGTALGPGRGGEERKLVTVLFADVVGSTELYRAMDPERLHAQMRRLFAVAQEEIERFGGAVQKFIGDAVLATFGLPSVHEDDAERAARTALAIRQRITSDVQTGLLPQIRMGINSGEVVANPEGLEKGEFIIAGDAVNLAARLQQHAAPGQILLGERTAQMLRSVAEIRAVPSLSVKGVDRPLLAWELLTIGMPRERELRATPFVGREEELTLLEGHLRRVRRESRGHVVTILAPAGVGKTRLVQEFRARAGGIRMLRGRAVPYGTGVPFWSVGEAIREECGILFGDPLDAARVKLVETAQRLEIPDAVPAIRTILGLGAEGSSPPRDELFAGMRAFFQALARRAPLLLILEDLHWAEDVTLDFVDHAADWIRDCSLLLLVLSRPELLERQSQWMGGKRSATTIVLDPLSSDESRALVAGILGGRKMPDALLELLLERADGNPLFMEEILRVLMERGVLAERGEWVLTLPIADLEIPDTINAVISARVDALPAREKRVLQAAAVQGKEFWLGGVREIMPSDGIDDAVRGLVAKELLIHKRRSTLVGEEELTFRHILIRDVAYATIAKQTRAEMHTRVAAWMDRVAGDREAEFADFLAHHWLQAVHLRRELGLSADESAIGEAITHLMAAGDRAAGVYANTTALDHYTKALDLSPSDDVRLRLLEGRGRVWMLLGQYERAREDFQAVRDAAHHSSARRWEAVALDHIGHTYRRQDQISRALEHLEAALHLSRDVGDPVLTGRILNHIGFTYFSDGKNDQALEAHTGARTLLESAGSPGDLAESFHGLAENLFFQGKFQDTLAWFAESIRICDAIGNRSLAEENRFMRSFALLKLGRYTNAEEESERAIRVLEEIGDVWNLIPALVSASFLGSALGQFGKALQYASRSAGLAHQLGAIRFHVYSLLALGVAHRELEDYHAALDADREAVQLARKVGGAWLPFALAALAVDRAAVVRRDEAPELITQARQVLAEGQSRLDLPQQVGLLEAQMHHVLGNAAETLRSGMELQTLAEQTGTGDHWRSSALLLQAKGAASAGDAPAAIRLYEQAAVEAERTGRLPVLWRAQAGRAQVLHGLGRHEEAAAAARPGKEIVERLAATIADERVRAAFLQSAPVQRVFALARE